MHIFLIMIWCVLCTASFVNGVLHTENGEFYIKMPQWKNIVELNTIESNKALKAYWGALHCVRSVLNWSFSGPNTVKYGPKKIRIRTFFCSVMFMSFGFGVIHDALIYIFLKRDIRKKFFRKIKRIESRSVQMFFILKQS